MLTTVLIGIFWALLSLYCFYIVYAYVTLRRCTDDEAIGSKGVVDDLESELENAYRPHGTLFAIPVIVLGIMLGSPLVLMYRTEMKRRGLDCK